ncbi:hypothetical protein D9M72_592860 [compost metagenome]
MHQPGAIEDAGAEIAGQSRQPAAAEKSAGITHRVLPRHAGPIGERRAGDNDRAEELWPERGDDHHGPPGLAIADHARLAVC